MKLMVSCKDKYHMGQKCDDQSETDVIWCSETPTLPAKQLCVCGFCYSSFALFSFFPGETPLKRHRDELLR